MAWSESDSRLYQELAHVAVPGRAEQVAALLTLLPFGVASTARVVELGCGEGFLSAAVLRAYSGCSVLALDGSADMRAAASARLAEFGSRASVEAFDLQATDWWPLLEGADAVVSSLVIHHLDADGKRQLFEAIARRLSDAGAVLIADLVEPQRAEALELFAGGWDQATRQQAHDAPELYEQFLDSHWNVYRFPDPVDMPSPLFEQLQWLRGAGLVGVDCFWLRAAHAIYGGYRSAQRSADAGAPLAYADAVRIAEQVLR